MSGRCVQFVWSLQHWFDDVQNANNKPDVYAEIGGLQWTGALQDIIDVNQLEMGCVELMLSSTLRSWRQSGKDTQSTVDYILLKPIVICTSHFLNCKKFGTCMMDPDMQCTEQWYFTVNWLKLMLVACLNVISVMAYLVSLVLLVNKLMGIGGGKPAHF